MQCYGQFPGYSQGGICLERLAVNLVFPVLLEGITVSSERLDWADVVYCPDSRVEHNAWHEVDA